MGLCTGLPNARDTVLMGSLAPGPACMPFAAICCQCSRPTSQLNPAGSC